VTEPLEVEPVVSVVIPAYNEEWRILPTIGAIATHMSARNEPWELIICDDGSKDSTVALVQDLRFANLRLLIAEKNAGKGDAVRRGMLAARGKVVLFADADQSTPIEQFDRLYDRIKEGFDVVVGSRAAEGAEVSGKSLSRRILSGGLRLVVSRGFGVTVSDTQCGFKLLTRKAALDLFSRQLLDGFSFDLEVLYLAHKFGYRVAEVPVEWIDAPGSTVDTARVSMEFVRDLIRIRQYDLQRRYGQSKNDPAQTVEAVGNTARSKEPQR
jgi:dolichyl-phosphate beta-glucosyltransferase